MHAGAAPDERAARAATAARSCAEHGQRSASACITGTRTTAVWGAGQGPRRPAARTTTELACDLVVVAAGIRPNIDLAVDQRVHRRAGDRRRRPDAHRSTTTTSTPSASACSTAARSTAWSRRCGSRPWCWPTRSPAPTRTPRTTARGPRPSSRSPASRSPSMGVHRAGAGRPTSTSSSPSRSRGRLQVAGHPRRQAHRRHAARRQQQGRLPAAGLRPRPAAARGAASSCCSTSAARRTRSASPSCADDAQVCNCNGVTKGAHRARAVEGGCKTVTGVMDKTRAGKGCGSCKALVAQIVEWAAGGAVEEDPSAHYYVPGIPMDKPALMAGDPRAATCGRSSAVFAALAPEGAEDAKSKMGLASLLKMMWGERRTSTRRTPGSSTTGCTPTSRRTARSRWSRRCGAASPPPSSCAGSPTSPRSTTVPMVKLTGGQRIDLLGITQGGPAGRLGRPRHAVRVRVRQVASAR